MTNIVIELPFESITTGNIHNSVAHKSNSNTAESISVLCSLYVYTKLVHRNMTLAHGNTTLVHGKKYVVKPTNT